jgi:L-threonylcarbamoyladenylate synthase
VTDTVWGLGCLPTSEKAVRRIYEIKRREPQKPLILMSHDIYPLLHYVEDVPKAAHLLMKKHFPGALTLVLKKSKNTPDYLTSGLETVGIRVPDNENFRQICLEAPGGVLATTSANLSGQPSALTYEQACENMGVLADLIIPGKGAKGLESTIAEVCGDEIKILRQGAVTI